MHAFTSHPVSPSPFPSFNDSTVVAQPVPGRKTPAVESTLLLRILTTTLAAHLLFVGWVGFGLPTPVVRPKRPAPRPTAAKLIEDVKLEEVPPPEAPKPADPLKLQAPPELPAAAAIDLPPVSDVQPIAAVPLSVPVAFGLAVQGKVRLVSDASLASGSVGGRALNEPVAIDGNSAAEKNLLIPDLTYPREALALKQQGTVLLEFQTSATGQIFGVRVRQGSGFDSIDEAALENLNQGRWLGRAGYYLKAYEFKLN